jgi:tensin
MWSSWADTKASLTSVLEKTGDALSKAASQAKQAPEPTLPERADMTASTDKEESETEKKRKEILANLQTGWSSVLHVTKEKWQVAQNVLEEQQSRLQERINEARHTYYKRDPKLPLDTIALRDAQVVYITDRLITMSHPAMASAVNADITGQRKLAAVGHMLTQRHNGRFMVWNISEVDYETRILDEQVLTFSFPGSPSPPLGLLLKLLISMEAWMKADDRNVAVVHCLTGKGRTSMVLASFLCWMGQAGFGDIYKALNYIAACKQLSFEELTIPSQRRYASYFKNMLDGVRPSQPPLMLKRIIMSEAPQFARGPPRDDDKLANRTDRLMGCAPYLQLFKAGDLLATAPASLHYQQAQNELPFVQVADGTVSFNINCVVQGDILIRCRHLTSKKTRVSMFRAAFHTGYVPPKVLRLKKSELDGACNDERFKDDFFIDLIFEAMDAEEASKLIMEQEQQLMLKHMETDAGTDDGSNAVATAGNSDEANALVGGAKHVSAAAYDIMLHRESRFWDVINARRQEQASIDAKGEHLKDPTWGPSIGRRRDFDRPNKAIAETEEDAKSKAQESDFQTFSIGGELDFLPQEDSKAPVIEPPKKDSLMEALMGALGEGGHLDDGPEAVIFDYSGSTPSQDTPSDVKITATVDATSTASSVIAPEPGNADTAPSVTTSDDTDEVAALLADADLNLEGDVDALLAEAGGEDGLDLDFDDEELEDLENFLSK